MNNPTNINWEFERELININDLEALEYTEENWEISFEYNGQKLTSVIDFTLDLKQYDEEETNSHDVDVVSVDITINKLLDESEEVFELTTKNEIALQNKLAVELKIEF